MKNLFIILSILLLSSPVIGQSSKYESVSQCVLKTMEDRKLTGNKMFEMVKEECERILGNSYNKEKKNKGVEKLKFNSQEVREMWHSCFTEFKVLIPNMKEEVRAFLCDCYSDHMRMKYTPDQVKSLTKAQLRKLGLAMRKTCPLPSSKPKIDT